METNWNNKTTWLVQTQETCLVEAGTPPPSKIAKTKAKQDTIARQLLKATAILGGPKSHSLHITTFLHASKHYYYLTSTVYNFQAQANKQKLKLKLKQRFSKQKPPNNKQGLIIIRA